MSDEAQRLIDEALELGVESISVSRRAAALPAELPEFLAILSVDRHSTDEAGRHASQSVSIMGHGPSWLEALREAVGKLRPVAPIADGREPQMAIAGRPDLLRRRVS
jgi:hypothetical protein